MLFLLYMVIEFTGLSKPVIVCMWQHRRFLETVMACTCL